MTPPNWRQPVAQELFLRCRARDCARSRLRGHRIAGPISRHRPHPDGGVVARRCAWSQGHRPGQGRAVDHGLAAASGTGDRLGRGGLPGRRIRNAGRRARRETGRRVAQRAGDRGVRAQVPAGPALSSPGDARRRRPGDPDRAGERGEMEGRPGPGGHHGLLGRRPPRLDGRHAFQRRQARRRRSGRAPELAARPADPGLPGHRPGHAVRSRRLAAKTCWGRTPRRS